MTPNVSTEATPSKAIDEKEGIHEDIHKPAEVEVKAEPEEEDGGW